MPSNHSDQKLVHVTQAAAREIPGRREFFKYRDLGVKEGSSGNLNAQTMRAVKGMTEPTGWHFHECDGQFLYILNGWIDMEFETGDEIHLARGDSIFIPGGMRHNETATSDDMELLEVSMPGTMGTVPCNPPSIND